MLAGPPRPRGTGSLPAVPPQQCQPEMSPRRGLGSAADRPQHDCPLCQTPSHDFRRLLSSLPPLPPAWHCEPVGLAESALSTGFLSEGPRLGASSGSAPLTSHVFDLVQAAAFSALFDRANDRPTNTFQN